MDSNSVSPLPPPEAPLEMMEINEKTPPRSPSGHDMPPPPDEKRDKLTRIVNRIVPTGHKGLRNRIYERLKQEFLYYNESQVNEADKIWRANEVDSLNKNCNSMSDIWSLGLIALFIYSYGTVPQGNPKEIEISKNEIQYADLELNQLLTQMLENDAVLRPTISEICKHIYIWPKERKWHFLLTTISMISYESSTEYYGQQQYALGNYLKTVWNHQKVKTYWISSAFMNLPCTAISKGARHDSPIDLLKFLVKAQVEYPYLFCQPSVVLQTYPDLPFLIYSALKFKEQMAWETFPKLCSFLV